MFTEAFAATATNNIYNKPSQAQIAEYLKREGKFTNWKERFDHTALPWIKWGSWYFNHYPVRTQIIPGDTRPDGLQAALASFTFRSLAKGYVEPNAHGSHTITVTDVSIYVDDRFAFQQKESFELWSCENKAFRFKRFGAKESFFELTGSDFLRFQQTYDIGKDFLVLTPTHALESFQGIQYDWP
jgi:hypothetical protein